MLISHIFCVRLSIFFCYHFVNYNKMTLNKSLFKDLFKRDPY